MVGSGKEESRRSKEHAKEIKKRSQMVVFGSFGIKISPDDRTQDGGFSYCDPCTHKAASAVAASSPHGRIPRIDAGTVCVISGFQVPVSFYIMDPRSVGRWN